MRTLFFALVLITLSCKKKEDPAPVTPTPTPEPTEIMAYFYVSGPTNFTFAVNWDSDPIDDTTFYSGIPMFSKLIKQKTITVFARSPKGGKDSMYVRILHSPQKTILNDTVISKQVSLW